MPDILLAIAGAVEKVFGAHFQGIKKLEARVIVNLLAAYWI
jgi:hypothetical protein